MILVRKKPLGVVMLTIFTIALGCGYFFGAMMFTPSLPAITDYFDTSSSLSRMTVSSFFVTMAISQLIYGPASDKYGRKPLILIGSIIFALGSILCILSHSIIFLIFSRAIQGLGAGALITLARTLVQDYFRKEHFLKASILDEYIFCSSSSYFSSYWRFFTVSFWLAEQFYFYVYFCG
ncbi:MFS transporter [Francisella philomiragia]|uniref:MFS transporter n=1 Tax=Francisella philomiragia TaxID=28110 RepID=UPI0035154E70